MLACVLSPKALAAGDRQAGRLNDQCSMFNFKVRLGIRSPDFSKNIY